MPDHPIDRAQARVTSLLRGRRPALVIEAGCGARSHLTYPAEATILGIDLLGPQLRRYEGVAHLAQGDVTRLPVASSTADLIVSWDVLEHLPAPEAALREFARVVRPDGLVVLALPNVVSLKGLVTRLTPWWFHVWVYRRVLGDASAGTEAFDQFPTTFGFGLRAAGLRARARKAGLLVDDLWHYEGPVPQHLRRRHRAADVALSAVGVLSRGATLGRYDATLSDMVVVLNRPGTAS